MIYNFKISMKKIDQEEKEIKEQQDPEEIFPDQPSKIIPESTEPKRILGPANLPNFRSKIRNFEMKGDECHIEFEFFPGDLDIQT